jgi:catechol 2,3-dioxygenase-like lactoylglutathione lyase family enzyme
MEALLGVSLRPAVGSRARGSLGGWLAAALAAASLLGCASPPREERTVLAGNPARDLLILPLNVAAVMPSELEAASPIVWRELEIYLRDQGKELKTVSLEAARKLWLASIAEARAANARAGYDDAARVLVGKLARHAAFDAVIAPSLYLRKARIAGRSASWDGVERVVEIEAPERLPVDLPLDGVAPAVSLHAVVLDPEGNKVEEAIAGLELLVEVRVVRKSGWSIEAAPSAETVGLEYTPRTDLFTHREDVQEGIAKALAGFLPPLAPVEERGTPLRDSH